MGFGAAVFRVFCWGTQSGRLHGVGIAVKESMCESSAHSVEFVDERLMAMRFKAVDRPPSLPHTPQRRSQTMPAQTLVLAKTSQSRAEHSCRVRVYLNRRQCPDGGKTRR